MICGSLAQQPMYKKYCKNYDIKLGFANHIHNFGMYIPNHPYITGDDMKLIIDLVNEGIK